MFLSCDGSSQVPRICQKCIRNCDEIPICKVPTLHLRSLKTNGEMVFHYHRMAIRHNQATEGKLSWEHQIWAVELEGSQSSNKV